MNLLSLAVLSVLAPAAAPAGAAPQTKVPGPEVVTISEGKFKTLAGLVSSMRCRYNIDNTLVTCFLERGKHSLIADGKPAGGGQIDVKQFRVSERYTPKEWQFSIGEDRRLTAVTLFSKATGAKVRDVALNDPNARAILSAELKFWRAAVRRKPAL